MLLVLGILWVEEAVEVLDDVLRRHVLFANPGIEARNVRIVELPSDC